MTGHPVQITAGPRVSGVRVVPGHWGEAQRVRNPEPRTRIPDPALPRPAL